MRATRATRQKWDPLVAAEQGAFYLDAIKPDWFRVIDLRTLSLESRYACVLGQCFEDYFKALERLVPAHNEIERDMMKEHRNRRVFAERFGFQVPASYQLKGGYERLGLAWKALIRQRRKNRKAK